MSEDVAASNWALATVLDAGAPRAAVLVGGNAYDAAAITGRQEWVAVRAILDDWSDAQREIDTALGTVAQPGSSRRDVAFVAPLQPRTVYCVGANYQKHVHNIATVRGLPAEPSPKSLGVPPFHFIKSSNCVVATGGPVSAETRELDFEAELAVVIGWRGRRVGTHVI